MTAEIEVKALDYGQAMEHATGVPMISDQDGLIGVRMTGADRETGKPRTMVALLRPDEAADLAIMLAKAVAEQQHKYTPPAEEGQQ